MISFFPTLPSYQASLTTSSTYNIFIPNFIGSVPSSMQSSFFTKGIFNEMHLQNEIFPTLEWSLGLRIPSGGYLKSGSKVFRADLNLISGSASTTVSKGSTSSIEISGLSANSLIGKFIYGQGIAEKTYITGTSSSTSVVINRATTGEVPANTTLSFSDREVAYIVAESSGPTQSTVIGPLTYTFFQNFSAPNLKTINEVEPSFYWNELDTDSYNSYLGAWNLDESVFRATFNNDGTSLLSLPPGLEGGTFESSLDQIFLLRSSIENNINDFETVAIFDADQFANKRYFYDYLIEPGILYRYKLQGGKDDGSRGQSTAEVDQPNVIPDFTGSFLYGKDDIQINFIYNGEIESFEEVKKDAAIETIGGKYPFIIRNSGIGYKRFSFSAFITHVSDPTRRLSGFTYSELISKNSAKNNFLDERYEDFLRTGGSIFRTFDLSSYGFANSFEAPNEYTYTDRSNNFIVEKQFRKKLLNWLYDGNPKVFKSDTEGMFLVKLTDITFEPIVETGRIIYSFSCTVTEIGQIDNESLVKFGIRKKFYTQEDLFIISNIRNFIVDWSKETALPAEQYFTFQGRYYKTITAGITEVFGPMGTDKNIVYGANGRVKFIFIGYSVPGRF